jgi:putative tricarboxylic transport membrane protein
MEMLSHLIDGFGMALQPLNLGLIIFGCALGLFIGAMPGLGSVNGVAILLPMTFLVPPASAIIFLAAIYYGAMYGGAISSIMLGIPGASTAVATTFDGRPLALQGLADRALVAAATASFVGGTISVILFTIFVGLGGDDIPKTFFSILIGLVLSAVGLDIVSGEPRLIFGGISGFMHGINFLVLAIGIYGIGEMLWTIESSRGKLEVSQANVSLRRILRCLKDLKGTAKAMTMGSLLGYFVGILPAAGATPGSLMAYGVAKSMSKNPKSFGKGNVEGVVAPEAANNAASTGSMLPMLTLGIPGSPTTAILLGGMVIWGLEPGPRLFVNNQEFVWALIASLYAANVFAVLINVAFIPLFVWVLRLPFTILVPIIFILCVVGGYAPTQDMHDVWLMFGFGVVGYLMRKLDYPMAPAVLAIVLGPLAETSMRQSLLMSHGEFGIFFSRPISGPIMLVAIVLFLLPLLKMLKNSIRKPTARKAP